MPVHRHRLRTALALALMASGAWVWTAGSAGSGEPAAPPSLASLACDVHSGPPRDAVTIPDANLTRSPGCMA